MTAATGPGSEVCQLQDRRITRLEEDMASMRRSVSELRLDMARVQSLLENQAATIKAISSDTREIRDLMRGGKVFGKLAAWLGGIVTLPLSIYGLLALVRKWFS